MPVIEMRENKVLKLTNGDDVILNSVEIIKLDSKEEKIEANQDKSSINEKAKLEEVGEKFIKNINLEVSKELSDKEEIYIKMIESQKSIDEDEVTYH